MKTQNTSIDPWAKDDTSWMAPGIGVTAVFDYSRKGCGSGSYRTYKRTKELAQVHSEAKRDQYLAMGFACSPIVYRTGA